MIKNNKIVLDEINKNEIDNSLMKIKNKLRLKFLLKGNSIE